jgi:hypothetical protein
MKAPMINSMNLYYYHSGNLLKRKNIKIVELHDVSNMYER